MISWLLKYKILITCSYNNGYSIQLFVWELILNIYANKYGAKGLSIVDILNTLFFFFFGAVGQSLSSGGGKIERKST